MKSPDPKLIVDFFRVRPRRRLEGFDVVVLSVYVAVLVFTVHHYRPFVDEAQEWLVARDSSLREMLFRRLHYEGHPALWAVFLWCLNRLHVPFTALNWVAAALAVPGIYFWLRYSPFPKLFRYLLPFTFFLQYQYAVVARPYVLFPLLLFGLCHLFPRSRPVLFACIAGVMANLSFHAAVIAGVLGLLYVYEHLWRRRTTVAPVPMRSWSIAAAVFGFSLLCSIAVAFPAPDAVISFDPSHRVAKPNLLVSTVAEEKAPDTGVPLDPAMDAKAKQRRAGEEPGAKYPAVVRALVIGTIFAVTYGFYPIAESNVLAIALLLAMIRWLWRRGCLRLILPYVVVVMISVHVFVFDHHTGQFLLCLVAAVWIALELPARDPIPNRPLRVQYVFGGIALIVIVLQIGWTVHCVRAGASTPTDPGLETAAFLTKNFNGKRVAAFGFESTSSQPYSRQNLYFNWPHAYWVWSTNISTDQRRTETLLKYPDAVVVDDVTGGEQVVFDQWFQLSARNEKPYGYMLDFWESHGYHMTHQFCGAQFRRIGVSYTFCEDILEPNDR